SLLPVRNGRECRIRGVEIQRPGREEDGYSGLLIYEALERQTAIGLPIILAVGEEKVMLRELMESLLLSVVDLELLRDRIGLDIDEPLARPLFVPQLSRATDIQHGIGCVVQFLQPRLREAVAFAVAPGGSIAPVLLYANLFHDPLNVADGIGRVIDSSIGDRVIRPCGIVLDIVDFMSELMESEQKVQI